MQTMKESQPGSISKPARSPPRGGRREVSNSETVCGEHQKTRIRAARKGGFAQSAPRELQGDSQAEAFPSSPPAHQRKSQLKISARPGSVEQITVQGRALLSLLLPTHQPLHPVVSNSSYRGRQKDMHLLYQGVSHSEGPAAGGPQSH